MATFGRAERGARVCREGEEEGGTEGRERANSAIGADVASIIKISISRFSLRPLSRPATDSAYQCQSNRVLCDQEQMEEIPSKPLH